MRGRGRRLRAKNAIAKTTKSDRARKLSVECDNAHPNGKNKVSVTYRPMPQITDLTWQQLETAIGVNNAIIVDPTHGVCIRVGAFLDANPTNKTATGVVEALFELREAAKKAQDTVNTGQSIGERLAAFPPSTSGTAVNGFVIQQGMIVARFPLATNGISGVSN